MTTISVDEPGMVGVVQDRPDWMLPGEAWTGGKNFRFEKGVARRCGGYAQALGTPTGTPVAIFNLPYTNNQTFWFAFTLAKAYVWESGIESNVTNAGADYTATAAWQWTNTVLAGIPIFNNGIDVPQWWSAISTATRLSNLTNWPSTKRARVIRAFGSYLIAINMTESGTNRPHKVLISHKADPGAIPSSWDVTDATKDATEFELTDAKGGELYDGLALGNEFMFYKKNSTHSMRFIGGSELWGRDLLFEGSGILHTRCVCVADKGRRHFVVTQDDIILHGGTKDSLESVVEGKNRTAIFAEIDPLTYIYSFVFEDEKEKELYFCYPTSGNTYPNKAFVYNYGSKTQGFRDWSGSSVARGVVQSTDTGTWASDSNSWASDTGQWADAGREGILFTDPSTSMIYRLNDGYAFGSSTPTAYLERTGIPAPPRTKNDRADFTSRKICTRIWPKISGSAVWTIQVGAQENRGDSVVWSTARTFNPTTDTFLDVDDPANGRLLAVRFEMQDNVQAALEGFDLDVSILGKL